MALVRDATGMLTLGQPFANLGFSAPVPDLMYC